LAAILLVTGGGWFAYQRLAPSVFKTEVATTEVLEVTRSQSATELTGTGYIVPQRQSNIACQVLSRISEMRVKEGERVKAGDILFKVEDAPQVAAFNAAKSRAQAARARHKAATGVLAELRQQLAREKALSEKDVVNMAQAEDRREEVHAQEGTLAAAEHDMAAADEDVRGAEAQLAFTIVRAPFDGIVVGKPLNVGELVGTVTEKPAVLLADPATLLAEIDVPERRIEKVKQ